MRDEYLLGTFRYKAKNNLKKLGKLPSQLQMDNISACGILLELCMGNIIVTNVNGKNLYRGNIDYTQFPKKQGGKATYSSFKRLFNAININYDEYSKMCDVFMKREKANNFVYEHVLNEITQFFIIYKLSPCAAFVHLYRILEFMSYSFPLIYAATTKNYMVSYKELKKFMNGDSDSELKFFRKFLSILFADEFDNEVSFEIFIDSDNIKELRNEFCEIMDGKEFEFNENTLRISFIKVIDIFIEIRNHYFHMLIGQGKNNFFNIKYDINDLFRSTNLIFINWLVVIIVRIIQYRFKNSDL